MKSISQKDFARIDALRCSITDKRNDILVAFEAHIQPIFDRLNENRNELHGIMYDIRREMEQHVESRSERWRFGEPGWEYKRWVDGIAEIVRNTRDSFKLDMEETECFGEIDHVIGQLDELQTEPAE